MNARVIAVETLGNLFAVKGWKLDSVDSPVIYSTSWAHAFERHRVTSTEAEAITQLLAEQEVKGWSMLLPVFLSELNQYRGSEILRRETEQRSVAKCRVCDGSGWARVYDHKNRALQRVAICFCSNGQYRAEALRTSKEPPKVTNLANDPEAKLQAVEIARHHDERARAWATSVGLDPEAGADCVVFRDRFRQLAMGMAQDMASRAENRSKTQRHDDSGQRVVKSIGKSSRTRQN